MEMEKSFIHEGGFGANKEDFSFITELEKVLGEPGSEVLKAIREGGREGGRWGVWWTSNARGHLHQWSVEVDEEQERFTNWRGWFAVLAFASRPFQTL